MEFNSCITDYISERVYGVWVQVRHVYVGTWFCGLPFGIYKLETENDGVVGLVKSLWDSSEKDNSQKIEAKK